LTAALQQANNTLHGKMDELSLVRRIGDAISQHTSVWSLSSELVDAIAATINCKYAVIYASSDETSFELQAVSSIFSGPEQFPVILCAAEPLLEYLERTGRPIQIADIKDSDFWSVQWPFPK